jgi:hypothetical protein
MNETNCLNNSIEHQLLTSNNEFLKIKNELNLINNTAKQWNTLTCELTSTNMQFELNKKLQDKIIENLNSKNMKLKEKINELQMVKLVFLVFFLFLFQIFCSNLTRKKFVFFFFLNLKLSCVIKQSCYLLLKQEFSLMIYLKDFETKNDQI